MKKMLSLLCLVMFSVTMALADDVKPCNKACPDTCEQSKQCCKMNKACKDSCKKACQKKCKKNKQCSKKNKSCKKACKNKCQK